MSTTRSTPQRATKDDAPAECEVIARILEHGRERPDAPAVCEVGDDGRIAETATYGWLAERVAGQGECTRRVIDSHGQSDRGTKLLSAPNSIGYLRHLLAELHGGLRVAPVAQSATVDEVCAIAEACRARMMDAVGTVQASSTKVLSVGKLAPRPPHEITRGRAGIILQSSGTTGRSRLAFRDVAALDAVARNVAEAARLTPDDRVLATMPLTHSYGVDVLLAALWAGSALHVAARFEPVAIAAHLTETATVFPAVPFAIEALTRQGSGRRPSRLRLVYTAGSTLPARIGAEFAQAWGIAVGQLYGATELASVTLADPTEDEFDPRSVGRPMRGVSIRIVDPDEPTRQRDAGVEGEVAVRAPSMMSGYLDGEAGMIDGHFLTGDLGVLDERGRLTITGRRKLIVDVGGYKVNPAEVEAALEMHPQIAACVVAPLPVSDTVTRLRAVYEVRGGGEGPDERELRAFLRERLSPYKIPRVFNRVDALPRTASGKVMRDRLPAAEVCR